MHIFDTHIHHAWGWCTSPRSPVSLVVVPYDTDFMTGGPETLHIPRFTIALSTAITGKKRGDMQTKHIAKIKKQRAFLVTL